MTPPPKGQTENGTKPNKSKSIEVRKKSVDWSQYFGIDRRKKKATFTAGQGTPSQDDEWMLQRYYEVISNKEPEDILLSLVIPFLILISSVCNVQSWVS